jgi:hypothetical protein
MSLAEGFFLVAFSLLFSNALASLLSFHSSPHNIFTHLMHLTLQLLSDKQGTASALRKLN